jgi:REP element-mobilizing transposase RayT
MASSRPQSRNLRKGRHSQPGQYYFLTTSVHGRRRIFSSDCRAQIILDTIRWLGDTGRFAADAAVVMPDHLHLVGQLRKSSLEQVMHTLKSYTAHRLASSGVEVPIWQDGYHDHILRNEENYRIRLTYILQNPVRAGLVTRVDDYPFTILPSWWKQPVG